MQIIGRKIAKKQFIEPFLRLIKLAHHVYLTGHL